MRRSRRSYRPSVVTSVSANKIGLTHQVWSSTPLFRTRPAFADGRPPVESTTHRCSGITSLNVRIKGAVGCMRVAAVIGRKNTDLAGTSSYQRVTLAVPGLSGMRVPCGRADTSPARPAQRVSASAALSSAVSAPSIKTFERATAAATRPSASRTDCHSATSGSDVELARATTSRASNKSVRNPSTLLTLSISTCPSDASASRAFNASTAPIVCRTRKLSASSAVTGHSLQSSPSNSARCSRTRKPAISPGSSAGRPSREAITCPRCNSTARFKPRLSPRRNRDVNVTVSVAVPAL